MTVFLVTLADDEAEPAKLGLGDGKRLSWGGNQHIWGLSPVWEMAKMLTRAVADGTVRSGYVGAEMPPPSQLWLAVEWSGSLVVDATRMEWFGHTFEGWSCEPAQEHQVYICKPPRPSGADAYRALLRHPVPRWFTASREEVLGDPRVWFGEFADTDHGGWVTLFDGAPQDDRHEVRLGNLAALGLEIMDNAASPWALQRRNIVRVRAAGLSGVSHGHDDFRLPLERYQLVEGGEYQVRLEIEGVVDPKVIIGPGTIFEQLQPGLAQNLAIAEPWEAIVEAGEIVGALLPAWCLNRHLPAPRDAVMRATPFGFVGASASQDAVWDDLDRRRSEGG